MIFADDRTRSLTVLSTDLFADMANGALINADSDSGFSGFAFSWTIGIFVIGRWAMIGSFFMVYDGILYQTAMAAVMTTMVAAILYK